MTTSIRVWAPEAKRVEVELARSEGRIALSREDGGLWELDRSVPPGTDYAFFVDGEGPFPDPRSPHQPHGVPGASRTVDHGAFEWHDASFRQPPLSGAVIYELHVGTFSPEGTFDGVASRLDHLVDLGVTHVELLPVNAFSGKRGWGYDGVQLYAPHEAYGGPEGLKRLVDACHRRGLATILDVVYNHLGPEGNYLAKFSKHYFTDRYHTPWGSAVNLDGAYSDEARRFFVDNALSWLRDYHFDGLRIDAIHAFLDTSARHFLEQLADEVDALETELERPLVLIAESDLNDPRVVRPREIGGYGIDAQWSDDLHHAIHAVLTGERTGYYEDFGTLADIAVALRRAFVYDGKRSQHRKRRHGRAADGLSGHRFLAYIQNHDQVGNRAAGDRIAQIAGGDRQKIAAALVLTSPYVPMIWEGEEWAASAPFLYFTDHGDPALGEAVRNGRRGEFATFGWDPERIPDPQARETFERSRLDWEERERAPHSEMLEWYRELLRLRREQPVLRDGQREGVQVAFQEDERWITVARGPIAVCASFAGEEIRVPVPAGAAPRVRLASKPGIRVDGGEVVLPPDSVAVFAP
jgi:maltooligosyltrehalose trehalohydrolase